MLRQINPFEASSYSPASNQNKVVVVHNTKEATHYMAIVHADNGLEHHINEQLRKDSDFKEWRKAVPSRTPLSLSKYQNGYTMDSYELQKDILEFGISLPIGQKLVHGGLWWTSKNTCVLDRPLSTTFNPQVALREADRHPICFDNGRIDLFLLTIRSEGVKAFPYSITKGKHANEDEVVIQAGVKLVLKGIHCDSNDYILGKSIPGIDFVRQNNCKVNVLDVDVVLDYTVFQN